jgi:hypothetical protein
MCAAGSAASFEIDQLLQPLGGSPPRKKMICEGGHGPQLLLLISYFFFFSDCWVEGGLGKRA